MTIKKNKTEMPNQNVERRTRYSQKYMDIFKLLTIIWIYKIASDSYITKSNKSHYQYRMSLFVIKMLRIYNNICGPILSTDMSI